MKTLGILGGMGPLATAYFYKLLVEMTPASCDQDHIRVVMVADPTIPDRTESILSKKTDTLYKKLCFGIETLQKADVDSIVIPCNTAHFFIDDLQKYATVPFIDLLDATAQHLLKQDTRSVIVWATLGTHQTQLYPRTFQNYGIDVITPSESIQERVMQLILAVKENRLDPQVYAEFDALLGDCDVPVIMGCTELSILSYQHKSRLPIVRIDPMTITISHILSLFDYC